MKTKVISGVMLVFLATVLVASLAAVAAYGAPIQKRTAPESISEVELQSARIAQALELTVLQDYGEKFGVEFGLEPDYVAVVQVTKDESLTILSIHAPVTSYRAPVRVDTGMLLSGIDHIYLKEGRVVDHKLQFLRLKQTRGLNFDINVIDEKGEVAVREPELKISTLEEEKPEKRKVNIKVSLSWDSDEGFEADLVITIGKINIRIDVSVMDAPGEPVPGADIFIEQGVDDEP